MSKRSEFRLRTLGPEGLHIELNTAKERIASLVSLLNDEIDSHAMDDSDKARMYALAWAIEQQAGELPKLVQEVQT